MEYYKEKPFIHLFQTPLGNYFYDVNTNEIVKIDLKTYEYLNGEVNNETDEIRKKLYDLEMNGYLKKSHVEITKHPLTDILPFYATNKIGQLILQVHKDVIYIVNIVCIREITKLEITQIKK